MECWHFQVKRVAEIWNILRQIYWSIPKLLKYHYLFCQGNYILYVNHVFLLVLLLRGGRTWDVHRSCWICPKRPSWGSHRPLCSQKCPWQRCRPCTCSHKGWPPKVQMSQWLKLEWVLLAPTGALVVAPLPLFNITPSRSSKSLDNLHTLLKIFEASMPVYKVAKSITNDD